VQGVRDKSALLGEPNGDRKLMRAVGELETGWFFEEHWRIQRHAGTPG
jgi:hypothetical protein